MVLNPRTCCYLIVHEETAPLAGDAPVHIVSTVVDGAQVPLPTAPHDICTDCSCICRFNITNVVPIPPIECAELNSTGSCGRCEICTILKKIAAIPELASLTHVYCAGIVVIQRGYLVPDYCTPIFKGLFTRHGEARMLDIEAVLTAKFSAFVKKHIIEKTLQFFRCGAIPIEQEFAGTAGSILHAGQEPDRATEATLPRGITKILPVTMSENTLRKHTSMANGAHQHLFESKGELVCDVVVLLPILNVEMDFDGLILTLLCLCVQHRVSNEALVWWGAHGCFSMDDCSSTETITRSSRPMSTM